MRARFWVVMLLSSLLSLGSLAAPGPVRNSLYSFSDWVRLCRSKNIEVQSCLIRLSQTNGPGGRTGDAFSIISPLSLDMLQSRSGVYFSPVLNNSIARLLEDSGQRVLMELKTGLLCQSFSSHAGLLESAEEQIEVFNGFVRQVSDDPTASALNLTSSREGSRRFTFFEAPQGRLQGMYMVDADSNAGIWAACQGKADAPAVQAYFKSIQGSSRRYH